MFTNGVWNVMLCRSCSSNYFANFKYTYIDFNHVKIFFKKIFWNFFRVNSYSPPRISFELSLNFVLNSLFIVYMPYAKLGPMHFMVVIRLIKCVNRFVSIYLPFSVDLIFSSKNTMKMIIFALITQICIWIADILRQIIGGKGFFLSFYFFLNFFTLTTFLWFSFKFIIFLECGQSTASVYNLFSPFIEFMEFTDVSNTGCLKSSWAYFLNTFFGNLSIKIWLYLFF